VHPDTKAWAQLPPPWEVLTGRAVCGLDDVRAVCETVGATFNTWVAKANRTPVAFKATPELVHGVEVSSPELARVLRRAGVFSGKGTRGDVPDFDVYRDETGAALMATPPNASCSSNRARGSLVREDDE
jgi:hypothetical protein